MQERLQNKCDQLIRNYSLLRPGNRLEYESLLAAAASMFTAADRTVDPDRVKECKKLLKKKKGLFSNFRGISEVVIRCKMALARDPEEYLDNVTTVYKDLKTFFSGEQVVLAATVIVDSVSPSEFEYMSEKTKAIYHEMRGAHPLLTSEDDMPFAAIMAVMGSDPNSICASAEEIYSDLKKNLKASMESRQMLSHILSVYEGGNKEKCDKICRLAKELKSSGHRLGRDRYISILGVLAGARVSTDELAQMVAEADDYLKQFKPFKGIFGVGTSIRRMYAVQMVEASLSPEHSSSIAGASGAASMISTSIEVTIITLIITYIIIASAANSASNNSSH